MIPLCFHFQVTGSVLSLLKYYKWRKFSIIYQEEAQWETIAKHLNEQVLLTSDPIHSAALGAITLMN